jgi:hypothetical protein
MDRRNQTHVVSIYHQDVSTQKHILAIIYYYYTSTDFSFNQSNSIKQANSHEYAYLPPSMPSIRVLNFEFFTVEGF